MAEDLYKTISKPAESNFRDHASKFIGYLYPIRNEEEVKQILLVLKKQHYDATHHCYAYRLGSKGEAFRANDDGEPSGTAGKPILNQLLSAQITNVLAVVVRYFGGTKLGVPGLINAYKEATKEAIGAATIIEETVNERMEVKFEYAAMNEVMRVVKDLNLTIVNQEMNLTCMMVLEIRQSLYATLEEKLSNKERISIKKLK
ncbi:IMPACT family protein [Williamwhitmania taraxaci]|uniref:Uncharacterized protein, YigZ family n=1 Tax=Williamwhitmania taraxaci TaxID=1640674 RepID=A0A1G6GN92_9BACT|nr:YigZ family protein [Williamwhitmania taraxaci]SDB83457.1 uncharacterized protein, YigZ family [Williamwhitmania taraxaci]